MPNRHFVRSLLLFILLVAVLVMAGCSDDDEDTGITDTGPTDASGSVFVVTDPSELDVPWVITKPDGSAVSGINGQGWNDQANGDYTVSWPELDGWNEPQPNVTAQTLESGSSLTFTGAYLPQPGTVVIKTSPEGLVAGWELTGDFNGEAFAASDDTTLTNVIPGVYTISFESVDGFEAPGPTGFSVSAQAANFIDGFYSYPDSVIVISPVGAGTDASWTLVGPDGDFSETVTGTGLTRLKLILDGEYTVTWDDVPNFVTPEAGIINIFLEEDENFEVIGNYLPVDGTVEITATFASSELAWELTGPTGTVQVGRGDASLTGMRPGTYSLVAAAQDGWIPGAADSGELTSADGISLTLVAEAGITVRSLPADRTTIWDLIGPGAGGDTLVGMGEMLIGGLAAGSYTLEYQDLDGWTEPADLTQSLDANTGLLFEGLHVIQQANSLFVNPHPLTLTAGWQVSGPQGFSGSGPLTFPLTETGTYTIVWDWVEGYMTPGPESANYTGDAGIEFKAGHQELLDLVAISSGSFTQGSFFFEACRIGFEYPHPATISRDFIMKSTEVTNAEYVSMVQWAYDRGYVTANQYGVNDNLDGSTVELLDLDDGDVEIFFNNGVFTTNAANHPVKEVSWFGAVAYCDWLSLYRGFERAYNHDTWVCGLTHPSLAAGYRLPTEAEWEYACRAGSGAAFANNVGIFESGEVCISPGLVDLAWHDQNSDGWSHEVGLLDPNAWGLYDMHGNVREWCNDKYMDTYYYDPIPGEMDPPGPIYGFDRVLRGGYFFSPVGECRSAARHGAGPSNATYDVGFRVVISGN
ncbi:MAG: formylglycine-generating enzyme family protein [bacterium]|nr:formylglycine-generating enzyme family protein [bacterium]